jgi:protein deglycase
MPKRVLIPLAEGFEEIEVVAVIDVLRRGGIEVWVRSLDERLEVEGAHGLVIKAEAVLGSVGADDIDMIVLPGGGGGTKRLAADAAVQSLLKTMDAGGKAIGAICAAPIALDAAGVLKPNYTAYPGVEEAIRKEGFLGDRSAVVEDANVMTSRGPGTAICFGLEIVKKLAGTETYESVKSGLLATYCE